MSHRMYADFSDEAYEDYMNGNAVDNNGLRTPKGNFYPDQPSFSPMNENQEKLISAATDLVIAFGSYIVLDVIAPEVKRFAHEKVYPFFAEKWDAWKNKQDAKRTARNDAEPSEETICSDDDLTYNSECQVIIFDDYREKA